MLDFDAIVALVYLAITLLATLLVVAALAIALHAERRWGNWFVPAIMPLMTLGIAVSTLFSERQLVFAEKRIDLIAGRSGGGTAVLQLITLSILSLAAAKLIGNFMRRHSLPETAGTPLALTLLVYIVAASFLPSAFGTVPTFVHTLIYPALIFSAAWAARRDTADATVRAAKVALYGLMVGSLVAAVVVPDISVQPDYQSLIPGLTIRLWGLGSSPNSIGPMALLAAMLEYQYPTRPRWLRLLLLLATAAVFVLAQSRTVWLALPLVLAILGWYRWVRGRGLRATLMVLVACICAASAALVALMFIDVAALWQRFADTQLGATTTTLSGRTGIWEVAVREWLRNPLFGYGPAIWGPDFRTEIGMQYAVSAHNQFLQTLSSAGTLGLLALLAYLRYLVPAALRCAPATRGVSLALLGMVLFRCLTETPLSMTGLIEGDALTHFLLFAIALRAPAPATSPVPATATASVAGWTGEPCR
jgi:O-antigen ligase